MRPRLTLPAYVLAAALAGISPALAADEGFIIDLPRASPAAPAPATSPSVCMRRVNPVGAMPRTAILPPLFIVSIMSRNAAAEPDISRPTSKPSVMPSSRITSRRLSFDASTT